MCRNYLLAFFFLSFFLLPQGAFAHSMCGYTLDPHEIHLEWTAFKTNQKIAVKGSFEQIHWEGRFQGARPLQMIRKLKMSLKPQSVESGSSERNQNLKDYFFGKMEDPSEITASVVQINGRDNGILKIKLQMNGKTKIIPLHWQKNEEDVFSATGTLDITDFGMAPALDTLQQACEKQHRGKDGVSKTWSEVDLSLTAHFKKVCR